MSARQGASGVVDVIRPDIVGKAAGVCVISKSGHHRLVCDLNVEDAGTCSGAARSNKIRNCSRVIEEIEGVILRA